MTGNGSTRRDLLRATAGLAATATVGGLAGCLGSVPGVADEDGLPRYAQWLPARDVFGVDEDAQYRFVSLDAAVLRNNEESFSSETYDRVNSTLGENDPVLPGIDAVDRLVNVGAETAGTVVVVEGSFDAGEIVEGLESEGYEEGTDYSGYAVYSNDGGLVGVRDGTLVGRFSPGRSDAGGVTADALESVIDVGEGDGDRLPDVDDDADALVSGLGRGLFANGALPARGMARDLQSDALVANGLAGRVSGSTTDVRQVLVYDGAGDVDAAAVEENSGTAAELDDPSVTADGRTAVVEGSYPTGELTPLTLYGLRLGRDLRPRRVTPSAAFDFDYDPDAGTVEITHNGGDRFDAENTESLRYGVEGDRREWPLPVAAGDTATYDGQVESGDRIRVIWTAPGGDRTAVVAEFAVP